MHYVRPINHEYRVPWKNQKASLQTTTKYGLPKWFCYSSPVCFWVCLLLPRGHTYPEKKQMYMISCQRINWWGGGYIWGPLKQSDGYAMSYIHAVVLTMLWAIFEDHYSQVGYAMSFTEEPLKECWICYKAIIEDYMCNTFGCTTSYMWWSL